MTTGNVVSRQAPTPGGAGSGSRSPCASERTEGPEPERMSLEDIKRSVAPDLAQVDRVILDRLASDVALVNQVAKYIVGSGGKRVRPLAVVIAARACGYEADRHAEAATIIELIHTATLLHDDVVDGSKLRRGQDTANSVWGNEASVLVGDFLYSRAFQMMVSLGEMRIMSVMADATNRIAEGEVLQLMNTGDPETTEERYFDVIHRKTARLFEAGTQIAAILAGTGPTVEAAMARYGRHLGIAFQLVDDVLDYRSGPHERGKNLGDDLAEGKPTLPLIHALRNGSEADRILIRQAIEQGGVEEIERVTQAIESTGGLDYTARLARHEADLAIEALADLPASAHKTSLQELANFAVDRTY
jgi:octaprenyl-diphosphate synthase